MHPNRPLTDPALEALLRTLPREAPTMGFADRVMAQVQLPVALPAAVAARRRIPWRTLVGLAALDLAVAAGLLVWFADDLLHGIGDPLRGGAKLAVGIGSIDPWATLRAFAYDGIQGVGAALAGNTSLATPLLIGAGGALLTIASLGRRARSASASSQ